MLDQTLQHILHVRPRGQSTLESMNFVGIVNKPSSSPIQTKCPDRNRKIERYTAAEFGLYGRGENRAEEFAKHAAFWREIANPDGTVNSAYGYLIWQKTLHSFGSADWAPPYLTPWKWAAVSLAQDKDTRQAYLRFSLPEHQWFGNKDQVCTMHGQFLIREDRLYLTMVMRSNDIVRGLVYDMPWFCYLQEKMVEELKPLYPDLQIGTYTHIAHSLHLYERDISLVYDMLGEKYVPTLSSTVLHDPGHEGGSAS